MIAIDIPALVKGLRGRLGLTQEQFAHEVGVTFSTVNQWENGRRRPQPFLVKRLLEMEAASGKVSAGRLTRGEAQAFKRRWEAVNAAEKVELASTPVADKFRQVAALLASGENLGWTEALAAEEDQVRQRWARLRRECHA
ncbi:MAG: helix-turn-helix transcriptional regulator [Deltaproteobacteria bacterium]|nr:helix-turn-helix transcriptional regulator [Deltaproteobacteria bacterium]